MAANASDDDLLVSNRADTGCRWHDDSVEGPHAVADERKHLALVADVDVHLSTAGLRSGHDDGQPEPVQQPDCGLSDLREHPVDVTSERTARCAFRLLSCPREGEASPPSRASLPGLKLLCSIGILAVCPK